MTIPITSNSGVRLYPHEPSTLIPLLQQHQPRSLPVLSSIFENLSISQSKSNGTGCDVVWATFPPDRLPSNEELWAVVIRMQEFERIHLRFYCSAEQTGSEVQEEEGIQGFVRGVTESIVGIYGTEIMLGAIDSRWNEAMRSVVDARELVECSVFLAPMSATAEAGAEQRVGAGSGDEVRDVAGKEDEEVLDGMGLMVDRARDEDMSIIQSTCDVPRPLEYYRSRSSQSTVIRNKSTGEAVCWIILHADGSIGALYTIPKWRRKGLAEIVVRHNITSRQAITESSTQGVKERKGKDGRRDFCYVFKGNTASERLWVKMGWEEGWGVKWIVNRKVEEARGRVERFSHPDEK